MFRRFAMGWVLVSLALLSGCTNYTTVREHKNLAEAASHISSVVILPADVTVELVAFTGENERVTEKESEFGQQLKVSARETLQGKNLEVIDYDFDAALAQNQNLAFAITQCKEALTKANMALYKGAVSVEDKGKFAESVGPHANVIAEATGADAMLLIEYKGFEKTAGMQAKDIAAGILLTALVGQAAIAAPEGASMRAALIDTNSGDILWTNIQGSPQLNTAYSKQMFDAFPAVAFSQPRVAAPVDTAAATDIATPSP